MAASAKGPFSLKNIPFGIISTSDNPTPRCAIAIGDYAVDLVKYAQSADFKGINIDVSVFASVSSRKSSSLSDFSESDDECSRH